ncbi:hypothetical protein ACTXG6_36950 [Pseudonocardia sp. Cha107L01]|uniref:hypothetical protein n=1 Tax=Pseudonocardia sp. Cha107L01 TaxID=3457576 RepID=UPI00403EE5A6
MVPQRCIALRSGRENVRHDAAAGVDEVTRELLRRGQFGSALLSEHDGATVRFVAAVVASPAVPDTVFEPVRDLCSDREIVEILQVIGF